jgi:tellurite resistance protein TerC
VVRKIMSISYRTGRKVVIAMVGSTLLLLGMAMVVLPGPAVVVIPLGLGILAVEFAWARRWVNRLQGSSSKLVSHLRGTAA